MIEEQTYAESKGAAPFDWYEALSQPEDQIIWNGLPSKSIEWVTCACGNQCVAIPRYNSGEPIDHELRSLGLKFNAAVCFNERERALEILAKIEARSAFLIAEIKGGQQS